MFTNRIDKNFLPQIYADKRLISNSKWQLAIAFGDGIEQNGIAWGIVS